MNTFQRLFFCVLTISCFGLVSQVYAEQRKTEVPLLAYPDKALSIKPDQEQKIISYALSPSKPLTAILAAEKTSNRYQIIFWDLLSNTLTKRITLPAEYKPTEIIWHPVDEILFVLTQKNHQYEILKFSMVGSFKKIYRSLEPLQRLIISPRPFRVADIIKYRLFFGVLKNKHYVIQSITEDGNTLYQVAGDATADINKHLFTNPDDLAYPPSVLVTTGSVLPTAFHPAGHLLAIENDQGSFDLAKYYDAWTKDTQALYKHTLSKGSIAFLPNGLGVLHWMPEQHGFDIYMDDGKTKKTYLEEITFNSVPLLSPDAKGIVGTILENNVATLIYKPVSIPLGDVANAWMFVESSQDRNLLSQHAGLFRPLKKPVEQLYQLYDSELYYCDGYDERTPTRPYIITTDVFWEVLAAAYEGTFILVEREKAIPHFWKFIANAKDYYAAHDANNPWFNIFSVIEAIKTQHPSSAVKKEFDLITQANSSSPSALLGGEKFNYAELKPRGHYQASPELENYFKAFKYLTLAAEAKTMDPKILSSLPRSITEEASLWIKSYLPFVSAYTRAPLVFDNSLIQLPPYAYEIHEKPRPFPLSWGFDNEILLRTVFHLRWPNAKQITGVDGQRLIPSALDVAAALGNSLAFSILENKGEFKKYPPLKNALNELHKLYLTQQESAQHETIYDQWIDALAVQWANDIKNPLGQKGDELWKVKRLQTGLASWTTLRHASVLVNERSVAECGEGGFESLFTQFPRGFVEADPNTFKAIAKLFASISQIITTVDADALSGTNTESFNEDQNDKLDKTVKAGILRRLKTMQDSSEQFADMANRELKGEMLKDNEYNSIIYIGRTIEHNFLVFKSLAKKDFALSNPEPMAKAADVAGGGDVPYLIAAVGAPLEWDFTYPLLGRKMIGKGAVYSFHEFSSATPWNDVDWRNKLSSENPPIWLKPYMSQNIASCPAKNSF